MQAIAILLVLIGHKGEWLFPFTLEHWPMYSYHMPLFVFISGYFFKAESTQHVGSFILKKCKHLLLPYFGWNLFYGLLMLALHKFNLVNFYPQGLHLTWTNFFWQPWLDGHQYLFNLASWFVLTLFVTQVVYVGIRKATEVCQWLTDGKILVMLLLLGSFSVFMTSNHYASENVLPLYKLLFFLPFYHFGYLYKTKLETKDTLSDGWYFLILFVLQFCLISDPDATRFGAFRMYFVTGHSIMPFITSAIGILFWLRVSRHLAKWIGNCTAILCIGENTWSIMMHHLLVYFLINLLVVNVLPGLSEPDAFKTNFWYTCTNIPIWIYWVLGLYLPVLWQQIFDKTKEQLKMTKI